MVQQLGQAELKPSQRSTFAGTEQSFRSLGELCHWVATVVWNSPAEFRWLALGSLIITGSSVGVFLLCMRGETERGMDLGSGEYEEVALHDLRNDRGETITIVG